MTKRRKIALVFVAVGLLSFGACYVALHPAWRYEGGPIRDNGVVSYPRYRASFKSVPLNREGLYSFKFRRFPVNEIAVMLNTPAAPHREKLENLKTKFNIRVEDQNGRVRCEAIGFPAGLGAQQAFVTGVRADGITHTKGIWLRGCNGFSVEGCDPCTLTVGISDIDPLTPHIMIVPTLKGGGIELP